MDEVHIKADHVHDFEIIVRWFHPHVLVENSVHLNSLKSSIHHRLAQSVSSKLKYVAVTLLLKKLSLDLDMLAKLSSHFPSEQYFQYHLTPFSASTLPTCYFIISIFQPLPVSSVCPSFYKNWSLQTFDDIISTADRTQTILLVSLDLSPAFDTINHSKFLRSWPFFWYH